MRTLRDSDHGRDPSRDRRADHGSAGGAAASLWRFSLAFYAEPAIAASLIALQDREGCDINLILFALWLGLCGGKRLDAPGLAAAQAAAQPIGQAVVLPLRRLRRALKAMPGRDIERLRARVATLELAAEKAVQHRLAATPAARAPADSGAHESRLATAAANLALYLGAERAEGAEAERLRRGLAAFAVRHP
jgi:uncharacterized protein (TIGR02444 family)